MIRRIDTVTFGAKYVPRFKQPLFNIKSELKAASIYVAWGIAAYGMYSACTPSEKQITEPVQPKTEQVATSTDTLQQKTQSKIAPNGYYLVKNGDNIWNISKALLEEKGTKKTTGSEIDKVKESIMQMNNKKYPSDTCGVVMIYPKDTLWVDPYAYINEQLKNPI